MQKYYQGKDGSAYLAQRKSATTPRNQKLRASMFADLELLDSTVLDFGCGEGSILNFLPCGKRIGVEIGQEAADSARSKGIEVFETLPEIESATVDLAISFHALEHVDCPVTVMTELHRVLRPGGGLRIVVPCETPFHEKSRKWTANQDRHLYTWTPLLIGNLAIRTGFTEIRAKIAPMPTGSRFGKLISNESPLGRKLHIGHSFWHDRLNTVLDARKPLVE